MDKQKVVMIGCGMVGSSCCFSLIESGLFQEMVLIDQNEQKAIGEAMDLSHSSYESKIKIYAGDYDDIIDASMIIITAGVNQKKNETRLDLLKQNVIIIKNIIDEIKKRDFNGILLIVSNPVDLLSYVAYKYSGYESKRVIGTGTLLDSERLRYILSDYLNIDRRNIHAYMIGEHGDSEFPIFSKAHIAHMSIKDFFESRGINDHLQLCNDITYKVRHSAYDIIDKKHATYYGIASAVKRIAEAIIKDEHSILPVSILHNEIYISLPSIISNTGIYQVLDISLNSYEQSLFDQSYKIIYDQINELNKNHLI